MPDAPIDPDTFRVESRKRWEEAAPGWERRADSFAAATEPVTDWLLDALHLQPGQTIVELAAGIGDVGLKAAQQILPGGRVLITDGAEAMVKAAQARADQAGIENIQTRTMEAEWIDLSAATVDGIVCRWGYMLLADPEAALRETRRVLKPGGRLALAAWADRTHNPWLDLVSQVLARQGLAPAIPPGTPGPFAFGPDGVAHNLLAVAGFADIEVAFVDFSVGAASIDDWWEHHNNQSVTLAAAISGISPKAHYELRDAFDAAYADYVGAGGAVSVPARALVASASA